MINLWYIFVLLHLCLFACIFILLLYFHSLLIFFFYSRVSTALFAQFTPGNQCSISYSDSGKNDYIFRTQTVVAVPIFVFTYINVGGKCSLMKCQCQVFVKAPILVLQYFQKIHMEVFFKISDIWFCFWAIQVLLHCRRNTVMLLFLYSDDGSLFQFSTNKNKLIKRRFLP